jgi:ERF superfamily
VESYEVGGFTFGGAQEQIAGLMEKLRTVAASIDRVPKRGRHPMGFEFVTESDLAETVREQLAEHGVVFLISEAETMFRETTVGRENRQVTVTSVLFNLAFVDTATGALVSSRFRGESMPNNSKEFQAASAFAVKYFLLRTFLIPSGEDPDLDDAHAATTGNITSPGGGALFDDTEKGPVCPEHHTEMRPGKNGGYFCSRKVGNDWCSYYATAEGEVKQKGARR